MNVGIGLQVLLLSSQSLPMGSSMRLGREGLVDIFC